MTWVALIRHGTTAWTEAERVQGRADVPLSEAGREAVAALRAPHELADARWQTSPLGRAVETAKLLGATDSTIEPRLIEMDWGAWEGRTYASLAAELDGALEINEARGLDFEPVGGESPRKVQRRLAPWLADVAAGAEPVVAVSHKGVIRALLALASGWDMTGEPPVKLDWRAAHVFALDGRGRPRPHRLNLCLEAP